MYLLKFGFGNKTNVFNVIVVVVVVAQALYWRINVGNDLYVPTVMGSVAR